MYFDPTGPARRPPDFFFSDLKRLNEQVGVGAMLCKSRDPDFLQALTTQSQAAGRSMPWLRNLILNADDALFVLPVHCVCQFVIDVLTTPSKSKEELEKCEVLFEQMTDVVTLATESKAKEYLLASQIVTNFASRLSSPSSFQRSSARHCLSKVTGQDTDDLNFDSLVNLSVFSKCCGEVLQSVHLALTIETDMKICETYLEFILSYFHLATKEQRDDLIVDVCTFFTDRRVLSLENPDAILPIHSQWTSKQNEIHEKCLNLLCDYFDSNESGPNVDFLDPSKHVKVTSNGNTNIYHIVTIEAAVLFVALRNSESEKHKK